MKKECILALHSSHYFPPVPASNLLLVSLIPGANLPPVLTLLVIGGKFAAGVVDTSGKFDLRISPRIFGKIRNDPNAN
jgi:hypothetical protein